MCLAYMFSVRPLPLNASPLERLRYSGAGSIPWQDPPREGGPMLFLCPDAYAGSARWATQWRAAPALCKTKRPLTPSSIDDSKPLRSHCRGDGPTEQPECRDRHRAGRNMKIPTATPH